MSDRAPASSALDPSRRPRVFYGWWMVGGAIVAQFVAVGLQGQAAGVFLGPMTQELGWSRAEFTLASSLGTVLMGFLAFFVGSLVDRRGARSLMVLGATVLGATLLAMSRVHELWEYLFLRGVIFTIGNVLVGNLVVNVTLSKWFVERRGWAISMASLGVSAASIVVPPALTAVVDSVGWRDAWVVLGLATWALVYPVSMLMRRQPEDYGVLPDGRVEADADTERGRASIAAAQRDFDGSFTRAQALRTPSMWLLIVAFGFATVGLISLFIHFIPFLTDAGYTRGQASLLVSTQGVAALLSKFAWGWAMQRYFPRALAAGAFVGASISTAGIVAVSHTGALLPMYGLFFLWGWAIGGTIPLSELIWASYFGRRYLGAVRGVGMPFTVFFNAGGPLFAGFYYDRLGSYDGAILTFAALWLLAAVLILAARKPELPAARAPVEAPAPLRPIVVPATGDPHPAAAAVDAAPALESPEPVTAPASAADSTVRPPPRAYMPPPAARVVEPRVPAPEPSELEPPEFKPLEFEPLEFELTEPPDFEMSGPQEFGQLAAGEFEALDASELEWTSLEDLDGALELEARPSRPPAVSPPRARDVVVWRRPEFASAMAVGVAASLATTTVIWLLSRSSRGRHSD